MIIYIIKSGLCLLTLFGLYHFVFSREKMYRFNRYYLLVSLGFGLLIPLNTLQKETTPLRETTLFQTEGLMIILPQKEVVPDAMQYLTFENSILAVYFIVTMIFFIRFAMNLFSMLTRIRQGKKIIFDNYTLVLTKEETLPFTFLDYIFINEEDFNHGRIEAEIIEHEKAHARQHHSFDIIFIEFLQLFFWFQPALYGFKKALKFNHEFLADEAVLKKEVPAEDYQNLILAKITNRKPVPFSSNLAYLVTKKRFIMMTKHTSAFKSMLLKLGVLPVVALLTVAFSSYESTKTFPTAVDHANIPTTTVEKELQHHEIKGSKKTQNKKEETVVQEEKNPDFPGGIGEFMKYFATNYKQPKDVKITETLRLVASFDVTKEGAIDNIKILKGHSKEVDEEVIRVLKASPKWIPGEKDGKKVDAPLVLPIQVQQR